ncbi:MAG: hypothetical protein A3A98_02580 [Candidatus Staskawiczbacteria bacterium RIFCSPLOWO2_01_FULL_40_39]|uniref:DUF2065 domain-containing protein n=1 Tax=Candidatus Staskawiczbacteria bacterium RIFCSPHIGHO2_01_FULL_39_25 TaxID=1802202 RepID=A0A1G2HNX9_9BACT|nr:MAG: hypothetical protein A2730_02305 [Candidatus Staskawiczbacteria bacterium RIFCSPHIGHO2_01_FULL_39_25]OGZ73635.1 MAG: hypothetical protein A3A98_02580 [Candidatus Staskawiczbacteria bacterium RIFCSPLOWO2_01_FULL_40_39]OGZ74622.1 MAG: hypothetical protein A3I87_01655 [Candidatus Staskawiczbacteria bacterium RIFCSPLOWO2_02_FULL_39_8]
MPIINFLAALIGGSMAIIALSLLIRPKSIQSLLGLMEHETAVLVHGILRVVLGIAILLSYSVWDASWKALITFFGWALLLSGAFLLLWPERVSQFIAKIKQSSWIAIIPLCVVLVGCFLLYAGFAW